MIELELLGMTLRPKILYYEIKDKAQSRDKSGKPLGGIFTDDESADAAPR